MFEEVSCTKQGNLKTEKIASLADCAFINHPNKILISGAIGSGKSYLACALCYSAYVMGFKTLELHLNLFTE